MERHVGGERSTPLALIQRAAALVDAAAALDRRWWIGCTIRPRDLPGAWDEARTRALWTAAATAARDLLRKRVKEQPLVSIASIQMQGRSGAHRHAALLAQPFIAGALRRCIVRAICPFSGVDRLPPYTIHWCSDGSASGAKDASGERRARSLMHDGPGGRLRGWVGYILAALPEPGEVIQASGIEAIGREGARPIRGRRLLLSSAAALREWASREAAAARAMRRREKS